MGEDKLPIVTGPEVSSTGQAEGFGDQQPPTPRMCQKGRVSKVTCKPVSVATMSS